MLLFYSSHPGLFSFDNISFGLIVFLFTKKVNKKNSTSKYSFTFNLAIYEWQIKFYIYISNILPSAVLYKAVKQQSYSRLQSQYKYTFFIMPLLYSTYVSVSSTRNTW